MRNRAAIFLVCGLALLAAAQAAHAQGWPAKPLRIIVPLPAGAGADAVARDVATGLAERLKQPVVVENRPGAAGNIGMEAVARSAPDGYTLLLAVTSLVSNPHLYRINYDPLNDFAPVTLLTRAHFVLVAHPALPATTVREVLALAKARPGVVTCAHASGSLHIACAWLKLSGRADINLVPYKGGIQALNDVIGGHVDMTFAVVQTAVPHVRSSRLRVLATTNRRRGSGPFGALPTMAETLPGFVLLSWQGLLVPAGTPREIITRLSEETGAVLEQQDVRKRVLDGGLEPAHGAPEAYAETIRREYVLYEKIIRETGMRVQ